jgi:hypothetical protein
MDCSRIGDQHHAESDGTNTEISNSRTFVGTGEKNEKTKNKTIGKFQINPNGSNSKFQTKSFWSFGIGAL